MNDTEIIESLTEQVKMQADIILELRNENTQLKNLDSMEDEDHDS